MDAETEDGSTQAAKPMGRSSQARRTPSLWCLQHTGSAVCTGYYSHVTGCTCQKHSQTVVMFMFHWNMWAIPFGLGSGGGRTAGCWAPGAVQSASITKNSGRNAADAGLGVSECSSCCTSCCIGVCSGSWEVKPAEHA